MEILKSHNATEFLPSIEGKYPCRLLSTGEFKEVNFSIDKNAFWVRDQWSDENNPSFYNNSDIVWFENIEKKSKPIFKLRIFNFTICLIDREVIVT